MEIAREHETCFLNSNSYRFFHWKFGLKEDYVVLTTENWRWDNIGFIVHFKSKRISEYLRTVLRHDEIYSTNPGKVSDLKAFGSLGGIGRKYQFEGNVTVFVMPDYNPIYNLMRDAKYELYVMAPYIRFKDTKFLEILRNKSCKIKIITADKRYADFLTDFGKRNGLNLEVELNEKIHGKLVISDEKAVITSANFDKYGMGRNREVGIILEGKVVEDLKGLFNRKEDIFTIPAVILLSVVVFVVYVFFRRLRAS